jgi:hypothetical protein
VESVQAVHSVVSQEPLPDVPMADSQEELPDTGALRLLDERSRVALHVLGAAAVLGLAGDALLRATPWGVNLVLWVGALVGAVAALVRWRRLPAAPDGRWLVGLSLVFAALFAVRDSGALRFLNVLSLLAALGLGLAALRAWPGQARVAALTDYALTLVYAAAHAIAGAAPLVFREVRWRRLPGGRWWSVSLAAVRGLLIAVPLLFVFGGLLMAADDAFERAVFRAFDWDLGEAIGHVVGFSICFWLAAGVLRSVALDPDVDHALARRVSLLAPPPPAGRRFSLGFIELATVIGSLDALFLAFVLVQARYLFGGGAQVSVETGLTYAEYARRGFFELVTVSALALPLLLLADALLRAANPVQTRAFRVLSGAAVAVLCVIMVSALQRMRLYQEVYGLTELRLYTTAFMGWLGVLFAWFAATVLRGRRRRFAIGALSSGFATVLLLNALNPDALIVRANVGRAGLAQPPGLITLDRSVDAFYLTTLSADAVPGLVRALPAMPESQRRQAAQGLLMRWGAPPAADWRTWSWSRSRARAAVAAHRQELEALSGPVVEMTVAEPRRRSGRR